MQCESEGCKSQANFNCRFCEIPACYRHEMGCKRCREVQRVQKRRIFLRKALESHGIDMDDPTVEIFKFVRPRGQEWANTEIEEFAETAEEARIRLREFIEGKEILKQKKRDETW